MSKLIDLTGIKFGRLTVIKRDLTSKRTKWICKCECGNIKSIMACHLKSGASTSCGCYQKETVREANLKHDKTHTSLHNRWKAIKQRCLNPNNSRYIDYGERGIIICDEWLEFENFYNWSINNGYAENLSLDRKDNNKGYTPDNCRWITVLQNNENRRDTVRVEGLTLNEISQKYNIKKSIVKSRYYLIKHKDNIVTINKILNYANQLPLNEETY